jgi:hypothetical protein
MPLMAGQILLNFMVGAINQQMAFIVECCDLPMMAGRQLSGSIVCDPQIT